MSYNVPGYYPPGYFPPGYYPDNTQPEPFDVSLYAHLNLQGDLGASIYPGHIPQLATLPAYSYFRLDEDPYFLLNGDTVNLHKVSYQIDCWSLDALGATTMASKLKSALNNYRGMMGRSKVSTSRLQTSGMQVEPNVDGSDQYTYHWITEWRFVFAEG